jgi:hypothetical protein
MNSVESINGGYCEPPSGFGKAVEPKVVDDVPWWKGGPNAGLGVSRYTASGWSWVLDCGEDVLGH